MRVFVAGATGAIGSRLVPLLVAAGYFVLCLTRSPDKTEARCRAGAKPVIADVVDATALLEPWQRIAVSVLDIGAYKYRRSLPPRIPASRQRTGIRRLPIKAIHTD